MKCPEGLSQQEQDEFWMKHALTLANKAEQLEEVPVGAVIVQNGELVAEGFNQVISNNDPTAHAEVVALRKAGQVLGNYRLIDTTLYVTLEPCPMCAGSLVHARVTRVVYGASDLRTGAGGSVFQLLDSQELNHQCELSKSVLFEECSLTLKRFFKRRRLEQKQTKINSK